MAKDTAGPARPQLSHRFVFGLENLAVPKRVAPSHLGRSERFFFVERYRTVLIELAVKGCGIVRAPLYAVKSEITKKKLVTILNGASLSPERMCAYYAKSETLCLPKHLNF